jgi:hypothetical protein
MGKILLGVTLQSISSLKDGSFKIVMETNEISKQEVGDLYELRNTFCKLLLSSNNISPLQEQLIDAEVLPDGRRIKSRSAKLRATMFVWFTKSGHAEEDFDAWYSDEMDKMIAEYKSKIPKD